MKKITLGSFFIIALLLATNTIAAELTVNHDSPRNIRFRHLTIQDGLSHNGVRTIFQDKRGFMWLGTWDGLHRFDGYKFKIYRNDLENRNSPSDNLISAIHEDAAGIFWIGTGAGGLNRFDPFTETFTRYPHGQDTPKSLRGNFILDIHQDQKGYLWISTFDGGFSRFDPKTEAFTNYHHDPDDPNSLGSDSVFFIESDSSGNLWLATLGGGLNKFDPVTQKFTRIRQQPGGLKSNRVRTLYKDPSGLLWISMSGGHLQIFNPRTEQFTRYFHFPKNIFAIRQDSNSEMWVGTNGAGLFHLNPETGETIQYQNESTNRNSLSNNVIWTLFEDRSKNIWAGSMEGGANMFPVIPLPFKHVNHNPAEPGSLNDSQVRSFLQDSKDSLWVGTASGVNRLDPASGQFVQFQNNSKSNQGLGNGINFSAIHEDKQGIIWMGGWLSGLIKYNPFTGKFRHYKHDNNPGSILHDNVFDIHEDQKGRLWVSTDLGLHLFDRDQETFQSFQYDSEQTESISVNHTLKIHEDASGSLWLTSWYTGLTKFNPATGELKRYRSKDDDKESLASDAVYTIFEDKKSNLWLGTSRGLNRFNLQTEKFTRYSTRQGLPNDVIRCVTGDHKGNIWISTNKGISQFNPESQSFNNFDVTHGLQSNQFTEGACYTSRSGELFFGGINGYNHFYPERISKNAYNPPVFLTDFRIFNKPVSVGGDSPLQQPIWNTHELLLTHKDSVISFDFAALNYYYPENNIYEYQLEGFEPGWNRVNSDRRTATYTSLPAGKYVFRVKGSNNDKVISSNEVALQLRITPPWWETWFFRNSLLLFLIGATFLIFRWRLYSIKQRNQRLEEEVKHRTHELKLSSARYQELFENMSSGVAVLKPLEDCEDFVFTGFNRSAERIYELNRDDVINKRLTEVVPDIQSSPLFSVYQKVCNQGGIEFTPSASIARKGKTVWRESWIYRLPSGEIVSVFNDISERLQIEREREQLIEELQAALDEIKSLQGILPLCSFCHKIRDDQGYWDQVDVYLRKYSEAEISHSICPDCMTKHYAEFMDEDE